jgi:hypothetical protein
MPRTPLQPGQHRRDPLPRGTKPLRRGAFQTKPGSKRPKRGNYSGGRYSSLKKIGNNSRSKDWRREWPSLKREFERAGITRCERCGSDYFLTPAHSLKRRHITSRTQMREVALLCVRCHEHFELQGEAKMCPAIRAVIASRPERRLEAA